MPLEKYTACPSNDGHGPISETESETSFFLDGSNTKHERWRKYFSYNKIFLGFVILLLCLNTLSILLWIMPTPKPVSDYYLTNSAGHSQPEALTHIYHDYDDEYLNFNLSISQKYWGELFPPGGGIVGLGEDEAAAMGLHTSIQGKSDPSKHLYLVAAFHQLHCLSQLRWITMKLFQDPTFSIREATYHHTMHCADIVRQSLMCNVDSTLIFKVHGEWPGEGGLRTCRNFEALKEWTTEKSYISRPDDEEALPPHMF